jgi:hypothetical protein
VNYSKLKHKLILLQVSMALYKYILCIIPLIFFGCQQNDIDDNEVLKTLKNQQAKAIIKIDGEDFYPAESIFKGNIQVYDNSFRINLTDQFDSNVIFSFASDKWYEAKPVKRQITIENQATGSLMVGKMKDKAQNTGEGFLMTEGTMEMETFSDEKCIIKFKGKISRYEFLQDASKWNNFEGTIVLKKPENVLQNISKDKVYY